MLGGLGTPSGHCWAAGGWRKWGLPGKGLQTQGGLGLMELWCQVPRNAA